MAGNANYETALLTSTLEKYIEKQPVDVLFDEIPLFEWLNGKGSVKKRTDGGIKMLVPLMYGNNTTVQAYSGYDTLDVSPMEGFTAAEFSLKMYNGAITISEEEEHLNSGEAQVFDLLEAKWKQLRLSFKDVLNEHAYLDGTADSKRIVGLALMIDSAGTYGNISRTANTWWASQETAVAGPLTIAGSSGLTRIYNDCGRGQGSQMPNGILTDQDEFEAYENLMAPYMRFSNTDAPNARFTSDNLRFRKAEFMWDEQCTAGVLFLLNSNYIEFRIRRDMEVIPFTRPHNQAAKVGHIRWMGQLVSSNCSRLGKLTGLTD